MDVRTKGFHSLTSVDNALKILLENTPVLGTEIVAFHSALRRVLAEEIAAPFDLPPFDRAAMDGYAVRAENTFGASQSNPIYFKVLGEVSTGEKATLEVRDFEAVRIATGAAMPRGADAVVMFEFAKESEEELEVFKPVTPGKNVSLRGEDLKKGEVLLPKGRALKPQDVAMLAALGITRLRVYKKPRVAVISTGDEIVEPGKKLQSGKIYDANSYSISALIETSGGAAKRLGIVKDDYKKIKSALKSALKYDAVILSGATSVGKKDVIPQLIKEMGRILVHGVAMRPGEPTGFGMVNEKPVFMLPGYPVAAVVGFETFVRPALQKMQGMEVRSLYPQVEAVLKRKIASELGRRDFVRVRLETDEKGKLLAEPIRTTGSGIISSLVKADGFIIVPENTEGMEQGSRVKVSLFSNPV